MTELELRINVTQANYKKQVTMLLWIKKELHKNENGQVQ